MVERNVLLVVADDMGMEQVAEYGVGLAGSFATMPVLSSLIANGVLYRKFYTCAFCSPTRACYMTGRYAARTGIGHIIEGDNEPSLYEGEFTLPEAIKALQRGHRCAVFGKWHLGNSLDGGVKAPNYAGWDHACFTIRNLPVVAEHYAEAYYQFPYVVNGESRTNNGEYSSAWVTDRAADWISAQGGSPWVCYVAFHAPHNPFSRPPIDTFDRARWPCPGTQPTAQIGTPDLTQYFKASQESMDLYLGRLLAAMTPAVRANTIIIWLADNGTTSEAIQFEHYADGTAFDPLHAKRTCYEPGVHCPMVISGAGVANPGREVTGMVHATDLYRTILYFLGEGVGKADALIASRGWTWENHFDSSSFLRTIITNLGTTVREWLISEIFSPNAPNPGTTSGNRAAVNNRFKLYYNLVDITGIPEFYGLNLDPKELNNLNAGGVFTGNAVQRAGFDDLVAKFQGYYANLPDVGLPGA